MLSIFPMIYPDEIFFSWVGRFSSISGYTRHTDILLELFGQENISYNLYYPEGLDFLCAQLPASFNITSDYIIENHTVFPFFRPFLTQENQRIIIKGMKTKGKYHLKDMMGANSGYIFNDNIIKVCLECFKEDVAKYGEGYIHRTHQIPGNFICLKHNKFFMQLDVSDVLVRRHFVDINNLTDRFTSGLNDIIQNEYIKLAQDMNILLNGDLENYDILKIIEKYKNKLILKKYRTTSGTLHNIKLIKDLLNFYSVDFITTLSSNIDDKSILNRSSWVHYITRERKQKIHPIRHLLFIRFLFGSVQEFIDYSVLIDLIKPFGDGPWPCLNYAADHCNLPVVSNFKLAKNAITGKPTGIFECSCGFIYLRNGPDSKENDKYRRDYVRKYGHVWEKKVKELLELRGYKANDVGKILHCKGETIVHHATRLGIGNYKASNPVKGTKSSSLLEQYKKDILSYMSKNPNALRKDINKYLKKAYFYMLKYDRDWFEKNLPRKSNLALNAKYEADLYKWHQKDLELSSRIAEIRDQILNEIPPIRVTKSQFVARLNYKSLWSPTKLNKLPLTLAAIKESTESSDDFRARKMKYVQSNY